MDRKTLPRRWRLASHDGQSFTYGDTLPGLLWTLAYVRYAKRRYPDAFAD